MQSAENVRALRARAGRLAPKMVPPSDWLEGLVAGLDFVLEEGNTDLAPAVVGYGEAVIGRAHREQQHGAG